MFKAVLGGLAVALIGLAVMVLLRPVEKWGFRRIQPGEPGTVLAGLDRNEATMSIFKERPAFYYTALALLLLYAVLTAL